MACANVCMPVPLPTVQITILIGQSLGLDTVIPVVGAASTDTEQNPLSIPEGNGQPAAITADLNALPGGHAPCDG